MRRAGTAITALLVLAGCLPSVDINERMPMSIHRDASGVLTVSFPVCGGDRVYYVGVGADGVDGPVVLRYGPAPERQEVSSVETFVVNDASVAADRLDVPWPVSETWPAGSASSLAAVTNVWASTTTTTAGAKLDALLPIGAGDWIVDGDWIEHDAVPVATTAADAKAAVDAFCGR